MMTNTDVLSTLANMKCVGASALRALEITGHARHSLRQWQIISFASGTLCYSDGVKPFS